MIIYVILSRISQIGQMLAKSLYCLSGQESMIIEIRSKLMISIQQDTYHRFKKLASIIAFGIFNDLITCELRYMFHSPNRPLFSNLYPRNAL